jgi:hypothetical protein
MSQTDGRYEQALPSTDLQIFRGPSDFVGILGHAVRAVVGSAYAFTIASTVAETFYADQMGFHRTGMYPTAEGQEQFGTSLSLPGPQVSLPYSSDALALKPGIPPIVAANMATLGGIRRGPILKGAQVTSIDVIYSVGTVNATLATVGIARNVFVDGAAPAASTPLATAQNGLSLAASANPHVINIPLTSSDFDVASDAVYTTNVNFTAGSGGTVTFYGVMYHCKYNFN